MIENEESVSDDIYKTPEANLAIEPEGIEDEFYVVSIFKFVVMSIATWYFYTIYWFFRNWKLYREHSGNSNIPWARALFYPLFTHSLFGKIDASLKRKEIDYNWSPYLWATLFVLAYVLDIISGHVLEKPEVEAMLPSGYFVSAILFLVFSTFIAVRAQRAINISQNDREGVSNNRFTWANFIWIAIGLCLYGVIVYSFILEAGLAPNTTLRPL